MDDSIIKAIRNHFDLKEEALNNYPHQMKKSKLLILL